MPEPAARGCHRRNRSIRRPWCHNARGFPSQFYLGVTGVRSRRTWEAAERSMRSWSVGPASPGGYLNRRLLSRVFWALAHWWLDHVCVSVYTIRVCDSVHSRQDTGWDYDLRWSFGSGCAWPGKRPSSRGVTAGSGGEGRAATARPVSLMIRTEHVTAQWLDCGRARHDGDRASSRRRGSVRLRSYEGAAETFSRVVYEGVYRRGQLPDPVRPPNRCFADFSATTPGRQLSAPGRPE
jgi:hypothetical protein